MTEKNEALRIGIDELERLKPIMKACTCTLSGVSVDVIAKLKAALSEPETVTLPKIDYDADMDRYYIPMPAGWEMQTKGKGSSFRLCDTKSGKRYIILSEHLHPVFERMAKEMHEASTAVTLPDGWVSVKDRLPELKDDSVLAHFENGSIETVHIEDYFKPITNGFDDEGNQIYTKWYLHSNPLVTHWMPLPAAPTLNEKG